MTAEERLELAVRTFTELREIDTRLYKSYMEQGLADKAARSMTEVLIWDEALMMLTKEDVLVDIARICGLEVNEQ